MTRTDIETFIITKPRQALLNAADGVAVKERICTGITFLNQIRRVDMIYVWLMSLRVVLRDLHPPKKGEKLQLCKTECD